MSEKDVAIPQETLEGAWTSARVTPLPESCLTFDTNRQPQTTLLSDLLGDSTSAFKIAPTGGGVMPRDPLDDGNTPGTRAMDLQLHHAVATNVPSGTRAVCLGGRNKATGTESMAIGFGNSLSHGSGTIVLGHNFESEALATDTIGIGDGGKLRVPRAVVESGGWDEFSMEPQRLRFSLTGKTESGTADQLFLLTGQDFVPVKPGAHWFGTMRLIALGSDDKVNVMKADFMVANNGVAIYLGQYVFRYPDTPVVAGTAFGFPVLGDYCQTEMAAQAKIKAYWGGAGVADSGFQLEVDNQDEFGVPGYSTIWHASFDMTEISQIGGGSGGTA